MRWAQKWCTTLAGNYKQVHKVEMDKPHYSETSHREKGALTSYKYWWKGKMNKSFDKTSNVQKFWKLFFKYVNKSKVKIYVQD